MEFILIVDDDPVVRRSLGMLLKRAGYTPDEAATPEEALAKVRACDYSLILMDMNYSRTTTGEEGLELLRKTRIFQPDTPVVLITAWGSIELAVEGIRSGAFDFITKPWNNLVILQRIRTAIDLNRKEYAETTDGFDRCGIIGNNRRLNELLDTAARIAPTDAPVLILGENGTGKEMIANAIHANSLRRQKPFVMVNLGGISRSLFESEMFGHTKGAFTGAVNDRKGRFELADKGTIFLDEIGDLDPGSQVKLLRVLQQHTFEPLGESRPHKVDIRVICATNADLASMVRERSAGMPVPEIPADTMEFLTRLPYPGNIRQLKNMMERAVLIGGARLDKTLFASDDCLNTDTETHPTGNLNDTERSVVAEALAKAGGNLSQAARILGITRQSLYRRKEKYGL